MLDHRNIQRYQLDFYLFREDSVGKADEFPVFHLEAKVWRSIHRLRNERGPPVHLISHQLATFGSSSLIHPEC